MAKHGKKFKDFVKKIEPGKDYELSEAINLLRNNVSTKFDSSLEVHMKLGVDPKHADQMVRGNVVLPHGTGKKVSVLVFAKGDKAEEAKAAGAEFVGAEDMVAKIQEGWLEFDKVVASPDMMPIIGRIGKILGPRGLMPNPKSGTVTQNIGNAIKELKAGKVSYRVDKGANIHVAVGKLSFQAPQLEENAKTLIDSIIRAKPVASKGEYIKSVSVSGSMSPGISVSKTSVRI